MPPARAELLELLCSHDPLWQTLTAAVTVRAPALAEQERLVRRSTPATVTLEETYDLSVSRTQGLRLVHRGTTGGPDVVVDDGARVWVQTGRQVQELPRPMLERRVRAVRRALDPAWLPTAHRLSLLGETEVGDRPAWRVMATPVLDGVVGELVVDRSSGVLLSQSWSRDGRPTSTTRLDGLQLDVPLSGSTFAYAPPPGATVTRGLRLPGRYVPALAAGLLLAAAGEAVSRGRRAVARLL